MQFEKSRRVRDLQERVWAFIHECVFSAKEAYDHFRVEPPDEPHGVPSALDELKLVAREHGLWNLLLPDVSGLSTLDYASVAEITGWSGELAPQSMNRNAPNRQPSAAPVAARGPVRARHDGAPHRREPDAQPRDRPSRRRHPSGAPLTLTNIAATLDGVGRGASWQLHKYANPIWERHGLS